MSKLIIALIIVAVILAGGSIRLLRNSRQPMGSPEALERANNAILNWRSRNGASANATVVRCRLRHG